MADGIAKPGRLHLYRMRRVQAHAADLMIVDIKDGDPIHLLDHLHAHVRENEGHSSGPTLVARGRIAFAAQGDFAGSLHDLDRLGLQDGIGVIAHQLQYVAGAVRTARPVCHRAGTGQRRLEAGEGQAHPRRGKIRNRRVSLRSGSSRPGAGRRCLPQGGCRSCRRQHPYKKERPPLQTHALLPFSWRSAETLAQIYTPMHLRLEGERDVCRWINGGAIRESNLSRAAPAAVRAALRMPSHFCGTAGLRPTRPPTSPIRLTTLCRLNSSLMSPGRWRATWHYTPKHGSWLDMAESEL